MRKRKRNVSSEQEEQIRTALCRDVEAAAKNAGDIKEIAELAYEPHDCIKRKPIGFAFPAACAAVLAVSLSVMQLFSENHYDFKHSPKAAISESEEQPTDADTTAETEEAEDTVVSQQLPNISSFNIISHADGNADVTFSIYIPPDENAADYDVYYVLSCEGKALNEDLALPLSAESGAATSYATDITLSGVTDEQTARVTLAVIMKTPDGRFFTHARTTPVYNVDTESAFSLYNSSFEESLTGIAAESPMEIQATDTGKYLVCSNELLQEGMNYDIMLYVISDNADFMNGDNQIEWLYLPCTDSSDLGDVSCDISDFVDYAKLTFTDGEVIAAAIPRTSGDTVFSDAYSLANM